MSGKHGQHQSRVPGKPKRCNNQPGSRACEKTRRNSGMLCRCCTAWQAKQGGRDGQ